MIRTILLIYFSIATLEGAIGSTINGRVEDSSGEGLPGVNVYIKDTYDGATTNASGQYSFVTSETGQQVVIASFIGYKTVEFSINIEQSTEVDFTLKEEVNKLNAVVITAGAFDASDERKSVVLKPLDIATTAGATADIPGALNTLPGTTVNGETGRLFVRGGTSNETKAFIDGVLVHNFYNATPNNIPSRSRFSPFLFKGTFFSTGGYSAEYGQAMSSVLSLNSVDIPDQTQSDISIMSVGGDISHTQKWENGSAYAQFQYTNLDPYVGLVPQNITWDNGFTSQNGTVMIRQKFKKSDMLKVYSNFDRSGFIVNTPNVNHLDVPDRVDVENNNFYLNTSYKAALGDNTTGYLGFSMGRNTDDLYFNQDYIINNNAATHIKGYLTRDLASNLSIKVGSEMITQEQSEDVTFASNESVYSSYSNVNYAGFIESDFYITTKFTLRSGLRYSTYTLLDQSVFSPRLSMAYKTSENGQISMGFGKFHQLPEANVLLRSTDLSYESADHFLINYQHSKDGQTFRVEGYLKDYNDLVTFDGNDSFNPSVYANDGGGHARGVDLFWRDSKTIKNADYWISYSFIDSRRRFRDYPVEARPSFAAQHNLSVVYKHFISDLKTQIGATLSFNSGRPYNDPNQEEFNGRMTRNYTNLSFNCAYLMKQNVIIYGSATNLLGRENIFGYEYEENPGMDGMFNRMPIRQGAKRFFFLGVFITLTKDKKANQLENL